MLLIRTLFLLSLNLGLLTFSQLPAAFGPVHASTGDLPPNSTDLQVKKDDVRQLDDLISLTEKSLSEQKELRNQLVMYHRVKEQYLEDKSNRQQIVRMVKAAHQLLQHIESQHLTHVLEAETLDELHFFSQIASKKGISRPR